MGAIDTKISEGKLCSNFPLVPADQKPLYDARYGDIILAESPENGPLAIKEKIIDSPQTLSKLVEELGDENRSKHANMVSIHSYKLIKEGNICSSIQKLYICVEYLKRDLASEVRAKRLQHSYFLEQEVLNLAKSIVSALAFLQKQNVYFGNLKSTTIMIDNNNNYKIGDPLYFGSSPTYFHCLNQSILHVGEDYTRNYLPPKLMYALSQKISEPQHNPYKSDVFILGVILIEVMALRNCYDAFDFVNYCVRWEKLDEILSSAGGGSIKYSDSFVSFVKKLISFEESKRPDFIELSDFFKGAQLRSSSNIVLGDQTRSTLVKSTKSVNDLAANLINGGGPMNAHQQIQNQQRPQNAYYQQMTHANAVQKQIENNNIARNEEEKMHIAKSPMNHNPERTNQTNFLGDITNYNVHENNFQNLDRSDNRAGFNMAMTASGQGNKPGISSSSSGINLIPNNGFQAASNNYNQVAQDKPSPHQNPQQYQYSPGLSNSMGFRSDYTQSPLYSKPATTLGIYENKEPSFPQGNQINIAKQTNGGQFGGKINDHQELDQRISYVQEKHTNPNILSNEYASFSQPIGGLSNGYDTNPSSSNNYSSGIQGLALGTQGASNKYLASNTTNDPFKGFQNDLHSFPHESHQSQEWLVKSANNKEFARETYEDGSVYEGDKCGGFRHGRGKFYYCDGGLYEGDWEQGRMNGYGVLYYPNGKRAYEGEWSNDKFNGRGVVYNESPSTFVNEVNYYDLDTVEDFWVRYEGEFSDDNKEGLGTVYFANGEKYTGTFKNDLAHGKGTFFKNDGSIVTGEWIENKLVRVY